MSLCDGLLCVGKKVVDALVNEDDVEKKVPDTVSFTLVKAENSLDLWSGRW